MPFLCMSKIPYCFLMLDTAHTLSGIGKTCTARYNLPNQHFAGII